MNLNGVEYYYIRNAQNDIIGLFDKNGATVASYTYDSWGKLISIKDGSGTDITNNTASVGYKNPYRYRGYRYDTETGLYYLQSRYYNPEWGRFINADSLGGTVGELLSHNVFAYCSNNPIIRSDSSGFNWRFEDGNPIPQRTIYATKEAAEAAAPSTGEVLRVYTNALIKPAVAAALVLEGQLGSAKRVMMDAINDAAKGSKTFPKNPNDFNPNGFKKIEFNTDNGRIIKWLDNKKALFEWDEDLQMGEHYHITPDGRNRIPHPTTGNTHIMPGDSIPDDYIHLFK